MNDRDDGRSGPQPWVSTGHLPDRSVIGRVLEAAHRDAAAIHDGEVSQVYPALACADPGAFGIALASVDGAVLTAGDTDVPFTIMSVAKPFTWALVCDALGPDEARARVGANATGLPFNATEAIERSPDGRTNPMVNAGAIAAASLVPGATAEDRWATILDGLARFAGRLLALDEDTYASASATNHRNRELTRLLAERDLLGCDPDEALDLYTRQSCVEVTARDLAIMGATLADGGVNPVTGEQVVDRAICHVALAAMVTAGLYETSGDWMHDVGQPAKSGIGGGIVTVSPGKGALGTYSPALDHAGNSVRGQHVARRLARELGLDLLASVPHPDARPPAR